MNVVLPIVVLVAFALLLGAFALWRRGGYTKQAVLMVILALVTIANVAILTVPDSSGKAPADIIEQTDKTSSDQTL